VTNPSTQLARNVVTALLFTGVREIVLAPGSRNAPLAFAVYDAAAAGLLRLHTRLDERTAGFLALGLTKVGARAAVICTSGTAVANLHPAVLEAAHAGLGLVVVTADRPSSLRGTGSSQTTDQVRIFGEMADFVDVEDDADPEAIFAALAVNRPTQVNVRFELPLTPDDGRWQPDLSGLPVIAVAPIAYSAPPLPLGPRTVVVAGDDAGPPARVLAEKANWPLFAEPSSGSRTGEVALRCYRLLLDGKLGQQIERVVVFGHPTLSRPVTRLLERAEVISHPAAGIWADRPFPVSHESDVLWVERSDDRVWLEDWLAADAAVGRSLDRLLAAELDLTPYSVAGAVARALPDEGLLFVGASSPIRDLDLMVPRYRVGGRRKVIANRGLAGIDGTVSSAIGAALGRPRTSRALALMGDVTFLHDTTGLVIGPGEATPDLTIVVVNDDGGSIFSMLEQGAPEFAASYDKLFGTPHGVDLGSLCAATRTPYLRVTALPELEQALGSPNGGIEVIEAVVRRDNRRELDARIRELGRGM
jgi:2-succinyl-5-enolpyruvyl-6-hydroxy-3-cyclohexene-1-carboxylate synthase